MKPVILTHKSNYEGCVFSRMHTFSSGHKAPIYDIHSTGALNQIIGHVKFANAQYGNVYYRGVNGLYDNALPALMRNRTNGSANDLNKILNEINNSEYFKESLKLRHTKYPKAHEDHYLNQAIKRHNKYTVEALLQHYAGSTRFLDVVDNHWVALWMSLHKFGTHGKGNEYYMSSKRTLSMWDLYEKSLNKENLTESHIYTYILLIAMPYPQNEPEYGIVETDEFVEVDLRKALPSIYLRPHAQHALVIRRRDKYNTENHANYYDMSSQVTAILRLRVDRVDKWLGNGALLTQENLFPSPSIDQGYNNLLLHSDEFVKPFDIKKYF